MSKIMELAGELVTACVVAGEGRVDLKFWHPDGAYAPGQAWIALQAEVSRVEDNLAIKDLAIEAMQRAIVRQGTELAECKAKPVALEIPPPPHDCKTEAEKTAYAFGWWKAMEFKNAELAAIEGQKPAAYRFTENRGNGKTDFTYHDDTPQNNWRTAYRDNCLEITSLYLAAGAREAQPMTDEQFKAIWLPHYSDPFADYLAFGRAIEKHYGIGAKS